MPRPSTTRWWPFPPKTREVQFDEKWSLVGKKEKHCDPDDPQDAKQGDNWDHVALDPEHRLVVSVVPGKRTAEKAEAVVQDFKKRTADHPMNLITSDEYKPYRKALLRAYGKRVVPKRTGKPGRPKGPYDKPSWELKYATVPKTRKKGRVVKSDFRVVFGAAAAVAAALRLSAVSKRINTAFVERQNGTDRNRNRRKVRKTYCFSKDGEIHDAVTYFTMYTYNFCWPVRTLRRRGPDGQWLPRTPAMAAGLADHVWSPWEWLTFPAIQRE
jgi:IS1 family transposase